MANLAPTVAPAIAAGNTWAQAHTRRAAAPTPERPDGTIIATVAPARRKSRPVWIIDLTP
ncbi:hypothetical protein ACFC6L_33945 [Kitasatospora phosalacinea]|uniref:hypothetical protein n=1 Tax=Kitasatospora phosalacinea TaxID=2065 RepID=UPI0035DEA688